MRKLPVSLVIISLNEEKNIRRCIESAPFVNEIVVLDSGSTDRTREIAEELGAKVFQEDFRGYQQQKQRAQELASYDWILSLDADEALSKDAQQEISSKYAQLRESEAVSFPRLSYHLGRWIRHGGWYPDRQVRLFHRKNAYWREGRVHERIVAPEIMKWEGEILHWVFHDLADQVDTNNEYSSLGALDLSNNGRKFNLFLLLAKPCSKFLETYLWKRGFLDGLPGLIISIGAAYSVFLKWAKLWERELKEGKNNLKESSTLRDSKKDVSSQ